MDPTSEIQGFILEVGGRLKKLYFRTKIKPTVFNEGQNTRKWCSVIPILYSLSQTALCDHYRDYSRAKTRSSQSKTNKQQILGATWPETREPQGELTASGVKMTQSCGC